MRAQRGRWRRAVGLPAEAGERDLREEAAAESGSAPISRGAPAGTPGAERRAPGHLAVSCGAQPTACQLLHGASKA